MTVLSFQAQLMLKSNYGIVLCRLCSEPDKPFFHYIMADKSGIDQMHRDYQSGKTIDCRLYGKIVLSGWGENPTSGDEAEIKRLIDQVL